MSNPTEGARGVVYSIPQPGDESVPAEEFLGYVQKRLLAEGHIGTLLSVCDAVLAVLVKNGVARHKP